MALKLDKVHHYVRQPGTQDVRLVQTNPYVRLSVEGRPVVFLQNGRFWYENGVEVPEIEPWLARAIEQVNPKVLKECGYDEDLGFEEGVEEEPLEELADGELPPVKSAPRRVQSRDTSGNDEPEGRITRKVGVPSKGGARPTGTKLQASKGAVRRPAVRR